MSTWKTLLLLYDRIDVVYNDRQYKRTHFEYAMTSQEIMEGMESFRQFPHLVENLTDGAATIECDAVRAAEPLASVSNVREHQFWPSPVDVRGELEKAMSARRFHSVLVYWPQHDFQSGISIPSYGWGWGMGPSPRSYHATYATVANASSRAWKIPMVGEVWLHEWLHGACAHFAKLGHRMPDGDADGADRHGYVRSPETGWTDYYRDLMIGSVISDGQPAGIPSTAWNTPFARGK